MVILDSARKILKKAWKLKSDIVKKRYEDKTKHPYLRKKAQEKDHIANEKIPH